MQSLKMSCFFLCFLGVLQIVFAASTCNVNGRQYDVKSTISRDISIIGGGSAGTYSAVRLKDLGKSIVVIEKTGRLGGHTQTYHDPVTGATIDYGVEVWHQFDVVFNYFKRLNVSVVLGNLGALTAVTENIDFKTGELNLTAPAGNFTAALETYSAQVFKYPYLDFGFDLPYPVPGDLLLSFGDFVKKYELDAIVPFVWQLVPGIGDLLTKPTIYVMKYLGISDLEDSQNGGFVITAAHDNSLLYESAQQVLGSDVLYSSTIIDVERSTAGIKAIVATDSGLALIKSKKLIVAIQPTIQNLAPLHLSSLERKLFSQFEWSQFFTAVIKDSGIPSNISLNNVASSGPYNIPSPPSTYSLSQTSVPNLAVITYLSTNLETPTQEIANTILAEVKNLKVPGKAATNPSFVAQSNHQPYELSVSAEAIANGFYKELYSLQGQQRTYWTSATWHTHDSSLIWRFTEGLLGNITNGL